MAGGNYRQDWMGWDGIDRSGDSDCLTLSISEM